VINITGIVERNIQRYYSHSMKSLQTLCILTKSNVSNSFKTSVQASNCGRWHLLMTVAYHYFTIYGLSFTFIQNGTKIVRRNRDVF